MWNILRLCSEDRNLIRLHPVCERPHCDSLQSEPKAAEGHLFCSACRHSAANTILHSPALISRRSDNVIMEVSRNCSRPGNSNYLHG